MEFSKKIEGCFNRVLSGIPRCLKEVKWVFEESFKVVSRMFQGKFKGVPTKIEGCSQLPPRELHVSVSKKFKGVSSEFQDSFKNLFKEVSRVFSVNCVSRKSKYFNEVLFCNFVLAWISLQLPE